MSTITWVGADGATVDLLAGSGVTGRGMPPVRPVVFTQPGRSGALLMGAYHKPRRISIPIDVYGSPASTRQTLRSLAAKVGSLAGGRLRFVTETGEVREIAAIYVGGMELDEGFEGYVAFTLDFDCYDPYFEDATDTVAAALATGQTGPFFPLLPLHLAPSSVAVSASVVNDGDVEVWPIITIDGPATNPVATHVSSGRTVGVAGTIPAGSRVTIDMRDGEKTAILDNGTTKTSVYGSLQPKSFWSLPVGSSQVSLAASGTSSATSVTLRWRRKWHVV